jgi:hypothetical protein
MRIDSSGNLLVGKTSTGLSVRGTQITSDGRLMVTRDGNQAADFNRKSSDGDIVKLQKDGTTVGSIGSTAGVISYMVFDPRTSGSGLTGVGQTIRPTDQNGAYDDAAIDLGSTGVRFKDLYLSNTGSIVAGSRINMNNTNGGIFFGTTGTNGGGGFGDNGAIARAGSAGYHTGGSQIGDMVIAAERQKDLLFSTISNSSGGVATRMKIDQHGRVTKPYQPAFTARAPSNGGYVNGGTDTARNLLFATKPFNNGSHYNSTNGRFTAPVTGHYYFAFNILWDDSYNGTGFFSVRKNDSYHACYSYVHDTGQYGYLQISGSAVVQLNANEWATCYANIAGIHVGNESNFTGFLLG